MTLILYRTVNESCTFCCEDKNNIKVRSVEHFLVNMNNSTYRLSPLHCSSSACRPTLIPPILAPNSQQLSIYPHWHALYIPLT